MSYGNNIRSLAFAADADLSAHQFKVVELTATGVNLATARQGFGVLQNIPQSGEAATVQVDGETKLIAGGTIARGNHLTANSGGAVVAVASATLTPYTVIGIAVEAVASGGIFTGHLSRYTQTSVVSGSTITQPDS